MDEGIDNLRRVLKRADKHDWRDGMTAYMRMHYTLRRIAKYYGVTFEAAVASFCALSPNNDYFNNLRSAVTVIQGYKAGIPLENLTVSTYRACAERAWRCLEGESFLDFTKGKKTRAFYQNILDPMDPHPVTIDGHMMSVWAGRRMTMKEAVMKKFPYDLIAEGVRKVAFERALLPNQVQSILWFTWKRIHQVHYQPQIDMFRPQDFWRFDLAPQEIPPFLRTPEMTHAS